MKRFTLFICMGVFGMFGTANAQQFDDFIDSFRGDTAVVKSAVDMDFATDALIDAIELDENAPDGRVYELKRGGLYWVTRALSTPSDRPLRIVGEAAQPMVMANDEDGPPIISGTTEEGQSINGDIVQYQNDLEMKNLIAMPAADDGSQGWTFFIASSANNDVLLENVYMEHTNWVMIQSNDFSGNSLTIRDSYFVNMSGEPCRRNGGVYDNVSNNTNELHVENSTHVMAQGMMYKFRNFPVNKAVFNHNTFVNASGQLFTSFGYQSNLMITNNLFVNSNVQGYVECFDGPDDPLGGSNETDQDCLPHGIVNINHLPDDWDFDITPDDERKVLVHNNGVFWDERLDQIVEELNAQEINGHTDWVSQMITMNSRTQDIFDDVERYPLIQEGVWVFGDNPDFVDDMDLMGSGVDELITWSIEAAGVSDDESSHTLPKWRTEDNPANEDNYTWPDWPVPFNLAYNNEAYLSAGEGGYPLGDLNWFEDEKAAWMAERDGLYTSLEAYLNGDTEVPTSADEDRNSLQPAEFELAQNYPNPFNPATQIRFSLHEQADVTLEVYDVLGRSVATLVNDNLQAGSHTVTWDVRNSEGDNFSSGVYIYRLTVGEQVQSRSMTLLK